MNRFKGFAMVAVVVLTVAAAAYAGQGWENKDDCCRGRDCRGPRIFDTGRLESITGQVVTVHPAGAWRGRGQGVVVTVRTGAGETEVHLGPSWYLDQQPLKLAAGDAVEIKGAKAHRRGEDIFLAAEVRKGGEVLKLRDEQGTPAWAGSRCNNRPGV